MVIRMVHRVDQLVQPLRPPAVGLVVVRPAALVLDHLALVVELLLGDRREEARQPIRLEPDGQLQLVAGEGLEVVRPIEPGARIARAAGRLDEREMLSLGHVRRSLEHQVLEQMREAGAPRLLVLGAHVVPQVHRHDRGPVVAREDHAQAVGQGVALDRDMGHESGFLWRLVAGVGRLPRVSRGTMLGSR